MFKPTRQSVGMAEGLGTLNPIGGGREVLDTLLNSQAGDQERDQAVNHLRVALDSLKVELEAW